jgi:hypothetical protein
MWHARRSMSARTSGRPHRQDNVNEDTWRVLNISLTLKSGKSKAELQELARCEVRHDNNGSCEPLIISKRVGRVRFGLKHPTREVAT